MPYGFPSGRALRDTLAHHVQWDDLYSQLGLTQLGVERFAAEFRQSELYSIDEFLAIPAMYERHAKVGKAAIARNIIKHENANGVALTPISSDRNSPSPGHWYRYLWNSITRDWGEFESNQLRIVTFNYDRSLEQYLASCLAITASKPLEEAVKKLRHLRIKHVYGQVGGLGPMNREGTHRPYNGKVDVHNVHVAMSGLRVMQEREQDGETLKQIAEDMEWARRICFLGFSFDPLNVSRLSTEIIARRRGGAGLQEGVTLYATLRGLIGFEQDRAKSLVRYMPLMDQDNFIDIDSEALLRSRGVFS